MIRSALLSPRARSSRALLNTLASELQAPSPPPPSVATSLQHLSTQLRIEQSRSLIAAGTTTVRIARALPLDLGGELPELEVNYAEWNCAAASDAPVVFVMPSMSHSALCTTAELDGADASTKGWWHGVVGRGRAFGIDLARYRVISASPLGTPFGSSSPVTVSPLTHRRYRALFPQITPADQARAHAMLLDHLGIERVHAVIGGSMGGMQALCFATLFPHRVRLCAALCSTHQTSPTTQALRAVQRALVESDPCWHHGEYTDGHGPLLGLGLARAMGTIFYRSREEFDARFLNKPTLRSNAAPPSSPSSPTTTSAHHHSLSSRLTPLASLPKCSDASHHHHQHHQHPGDSASSHSTSVASPWTATVAEPVEFDVERYLAHAARKFTGRYDANCWLLLSRCLDLQDVGRGFGANGASNLAAALARLAAAPDFAAPTSPSTATTTTLATTDSSASSSSQSPPSPSPRQPHELLLLPVQQDALIPAAESVALAAACARAGVRVHCEQLSSVYGHDAFLKEDVAFNTRIAAFLDGGVAGVRAAVEAADAEAGTWVL